MNKKMKKIIPFILLDLLILLAIFVIFIFITGNKNIVGNKNINFGNGWINYESFYSGSELNFSFRKSAEVSFQFETASKADQDAEIFIDEKPYLLSSPNLNSQKLTISVDKNIAHNVTVRHICERLYYSCQLKIKGIYVENEAQLYGYQLHSKILSILGDSISTIYGKDNYTQKLAKDLGYELHDASVLESTVTDVVGVDNAINRYKKDLLSFKSDAIIVFIGTNDAAKNVSLDEFQNDYEKIVLDIKKYNPQSKIFLAGLLSRQDVPSADIQDYNNVIENISMKMNTIYINTSTFLEPQDFSDGLHPAFESQIKLASQFEKSLSKYLNN